MTWIGYPNSTGLSSVQFRLTDAVCDPLTTRQTFAEQLWRLPGCFLCYTAAQETPPVAPLPALQNGFVTFGSFNALAKVTPEVMAVWGRVLRRVPGSRLLLKNKPFACQAAQQDFMRRVGPAALCLLLCCCPPATGRYPGATATSAAAHVREVPAAHAWDAWLHAEPVLRVPCMPAQGRAFATLAACTGLGKGTDRCAGQPSCAQVSRVQQHLCWRCSWESRACIRSVWTWWV